MIRHMTSAFSLTLKAPVAPVAPMAQIATPLAASVLSPRPILNQISSSRQISTRILGLTTTMKATTMKATTTMTINDAFPSPSTSTSMLTASTSLVDARRWMVVGSTRRRGRPIKFRTMRHKPWWVRRKTPFYEHDSKTTLTAESKDFVQDTLREDYLGTSSEEADSVTTLSPLKDAPWQPGSWETEGVGTRRCGVLALKIGVLPQWLNDGTRVLCTMFQVLDCHVINYTSPEEWDQQFDYDKHERAIRGRVLKKLQEKRGIYGVQTVGAMSCDPQRFSNEYTGLFTKAGLLPKRKLTRYFVTPNAAIKPGTELTASHFRVGDRVIVEGRTIGHGFEGVMIRWGFRGGPADWPHGTTKFHRKPGATGHGRKTKTIRGKKLPGHMGNEWRTGFNLKILRINTKYNVIYVKGSCPGPPHAVMRIFDSTHHDQLLRSPPHAETHPPLPTHIEGVTSGGGGGIPDENGDIFDESLFDFSKPSISYSAATK